jgi:multidrug efflux pump subunit AcrB
MTSLAFIRGVYPLVVATGAGAGMRQSLGTAVFSGMIGGGKQMGREPNRS